MGICPLANLMPRIYFQRETVERLLLPVLQIDKNQRRDIYSRLASWRTLVYMTGGECLTNY